MHKDYEDAPVTTELRAILINNLATTEDTDEDTEVRSICSTNGVEQCYYQQRSLRDL